MPDVTPAKPEATVKSNPAPAAPVAPAVPAVPATAKTVAPETAAAPVKPRIKTEGSDDNSPDSVGADPSQIKTPPLTIALGVAAAVLFIVVIVFWFKVNSRNETILQSKNRSDQMVEQIGQLQTQIEGIKADSARAKTQREEAKALSVQDKADAVLAKTETAEVQSQLEKARVISTGFQTQQEDAKVASLKHQGEVEVAQAQAAVMLVQWNKAQADMAELKSQLLAAKTLTNELQAKLEKAEAEIAARQKISPKK